MAENSPPKVTGKKAFAGENQATLISAIMTVSPPSLASIQSIDLPGLEYAVKKSLEKDPARRWQSARDLMDHLQWAGHRTEIAPRSPATVSERKRAGRWIPVLAIIATAIVFIWMATRFFQTAMPAEEIRFQFEGNVVDASFAISPNGHWIVYAGRLAGSETRSLLLRSMDSTASQPIAGTDNALAPFWSPDSKRLAFFSGTTLKTVAVSGGAPEVLCEAPGAERTGTWGKNDDIIFSTGEVLLRVPAAGGNAEPLTSLNISHAETGHVFPAFLPDGRHFLYAALSQQTADRAVYVRALGSKDTTKLLPLVSPIHFSSGKLLYFDNGSLVARGFDTDSLKFTGESIRIAGQAALSFTVSDGNVLIYQVGTPQAARTFQYSWVDANGKLIGPVGKSEKYLPYWDLSPDGKKAAVSLLDGEPLTAHVWVLDLERGITSRITTGADTGAAPRWSGDGQRIAYVTQQKGNRDIFARSASGLGSSEELLNSPEPETLDDWSPDSRYILYRTGANTNTIYALPLFGERKPVKVVESEFNKAKSHLSADGKWLAYQAIESAGSQIYVVSFPKADQKRQISTAGGVQPQWRPDGKGLYFLGADGKMMSVDIITEPTLSSGTPRPPFDTGIASPSFDSEEYATADGKRFLFLKLLPVETPNVKAPPPPTIVVNWTTGLKGEKSK